MFGVYLDTTSRSLPWYAVSVTRTSGGGLVLRNAALLPNYPKGEIPLLLVDARGYEARTSSGFVKVAKNQNSWLDGPTALQTIIGMCGFPRAKSLRPIYPHIPVVALPGAVVEPLYTHSNKNIATAEAALKMLPLSLDHLELMILEGQSNYTTAYLVSLGKVTRENAEREGKFPALPDIPLEHREDLFSPLEREKTKLRYHLRSLLRDAEDPNEQAGRVLVVVTLIMLGSTHWAWQNILSQEMARFIYDDFLAAGWRLGIDTEKGFSCTTTSPDGSTHVHHIIGVEPCLRGKLATLVGVDPAEVEAI